MRIDLWERFTGRYDNQQAAEEITPEITQRQHRNADTGRTRRMDFSRRMVLAVAPRALGAVAPRALGAVAPGALGAVAPGALGAVAPGALGAAIVAPVASFAASTTTDLAVTCDAAAAPAVIAAAAEYRARTGVRVRVFPTSPGLVLPQLEREIQNDIIVTRIATIDQAEKEGLVQPGGRTGPWRNRLVIAAAKRQAGPEGSFVVPDPSPASDFDGAAVLRQLGAAPAVVLGVIDSGAVGWTLANGGARQGLLHQTEVVADRRLLAVAPVPDDAWPPILYAATVTRLARRGDPAAFLTFLGSNEGQAVLLAAGLESAT
jgi:molybdate transport system substrate-binding protein